ncbi:MAG: THUMP domain-containing protein [Methanomassiliicoccales archaeon]
MEVILTSHPFREEELLDELRPYGDFRVTEFRGVVRGEVDDLPTFLEELEHGALFALSRVVPVESSFTFTPDSVLQEFREGVRPLLDRIRKEETFGVRVERRGLKGEIDSQWLAQEMGAFIIDMLMERDGQEPTVDLEDPDELVVFETLGRWCGVGVVSKELRSGSTYIQIP